MPEGTFGGPYIQVAAICTTPLIEQSGYLSVIRNETPTVRFTFSCTGVEGG